MRYFQELEEEENIPLLEAKLLIIGSGGTGKTSFMLKLKDANAKLPEEEDTTIGITITQQPKTCLIDGVEHTLNIWDFGGQDIYHPTHQFFLTKNSIYVLLQDGREQRTDFDYWLQVQELLAADSPLFIMQNIKHKNRCTIPITELRGKFQNIKDYFEVDLAEVKEGHKPFENIVTLLQATLKTLPHIGEIWPATRFKIRNALQDLKTANYISQSDYHKLCDEHEYTDPQAQIELLRQLHFLGTVLHFENTPFLEDIVITNPQWATDAVYAILDHTKKHYEREGHFTWDDLKEVWKDAKYKGKYNEILTLMRKFELCFELPDEDYTYIAPLLLPDDKPVYIWEDKGSLQMKYEYDFMPKGILARLIVRLHKLIQDKLFWKKGVVLEEKDTFAQITEDYNSRNISIQVKGKFAKELIFKIASEVDEINKSYHFSERIRAIKLVPCNCTECENSTKPHFYDYKILDKRIYIQHKKTIECVLSGDDVIVTSLLDNITPKKLNMTKKIFISYAHKDMEYKQKLETALAVQVRMNKVEIWSDQEIKAGTLWKKKILTHLEEADIIIMLLSSDFLASDFVWDEELPVIDRRFKDKSAKVVPVLLRPCDWTSTDYSHIQAVPSNPDEGKLIPVSSWKEPDVAWNLVVQGIKELL